MHKAALALPKSYLGGAKTHLLGIFKAYTKLTKKVTLVQHFLNVIAKAQ